MNPSADDVPFHVALISTQTRWHGGESQAALLAEGLRSRGHQCSILARQGGEFARRMQERRFDVVTFGGRGRTLRSLWQLRSALRRIQPHVLHANDSHALTAGGIASVGLEIPVRVAARRVDFALRSTWRYRNFADGLLCVSKAVAEICRDGGIPAERLHLVHDGVPPDFAASGRRQRGRQGLELSDDQVLLLTVAKLTDHKGHVFLLRAIPRLVDRFPNLVFGLAGDGELREELESLADDLHIAPYVRFLGYRNDVPDLLAAADLVVQPSHMEGLCSSLIDAMFAARPIVATTAGGIPDLLSQQTDDQAVAWLVSPRSPEQLSQAIQQALEDPMEALARGKRARVRAMRRFTADVMVEKTLATYRAIARRKQGDQAASFMGLPAGAACTERPAA